MPKPKKNNPRPTPTASTAPSPHRYLFPFGALLLLLVLGGLAWFLLAEPPRLAAPQVAAAPPPAQPKAVPALPAAQYVDEQACQGCHQAQARDWQGSHHQLAMQEANPQTVLGNFNEQRFKAEGESTRLFRRGAEFWVNTPGADGRPADFKVAYTFGIEPLQQYLIEVGQGRLQALGVAWDTRKQQWFHLYPGQGVNFKNPLHWSKPSQNANFMCVECHTTGYQRNFSASQERFDSHWNSLGVGCQACHGPASNHLQATASKATLANAGFAVDLKAASATQEIETCARCHARRAPLGDGYHVGQRLMDDYLPSALTRELYALDGKIKDEVFEYGSFAQSKMFDKGVRCSNCHNPHSTQLRAPGNAVCLQCHNPAGKSAAAGIDGRGLQAKDYDSPEHHRHTPGQPGAQCVDCHMPGKVYMGNDYRHDHSFSLPNPLRAQKLGTADACLGCHQGQQAGERISRQFQLWTANSPPQPPRYDDSLWLIRGGHPGAAQALQEQLQRSDLPPIRRATLLAELANYPSAQALQLATQALGHAEPQVRESAVRATSALVPPAERGPLLVPLLQDPVKAVRITAARDLLGAARSGLGPAQGAWDKALGEYEAVQLSLVERAEANLNLAMLYQASGRGAEVEPYLRAALRRDSDFFPALVTLGQWLEANGRSQEAQQLLAQALQQHPESALLQHTRGLSLIRGGDTARAMAALKKAAELEPQNAQYAYVLAVALHDSGEQDAANRQLQALLQRQPTQRNARLSLIQYYLESGQEPKAQALMQQWKQLNPGDPALQ
ncbi:putative CXXCH cytochrome family protein [Pseudomonas protegens]|uniref:multiheme c-type cytochrome n=1 Tax=Pseudomonas protegens TaxID=380021 RepID=UPI0035160D6F